MALSATTVRPLFMDSTGAQKKTPVSLFTIYDGSAADSSGMLIKASASQTAGDKMFDVQSSAGSSLFSVTGAGAISGASLALTAAISGATSIDGSGDLTMGTITMTGFSVDADGDTVTKSLNNSSGGITGAGSIAGVSTLSMSSYLDMAALADPGAPAAGTGRLHVRTVSDKQELFYRDNSGGEVQITSAGSINLGELTGLSGTTSDSFTVNSDLSDANADLVLGRTTGGNATLRWNGTTGSFDKAMSFGANTLSAGATTLASLNNSSGGITNAGAVSGVTTLAMSGAFSGATSGTFSTTLGVTGLSTLTGGFSSLANSTVASTPADAGSSFKTTFTPTAASNGAAVTAALAAGTISAAKTVSMFYVDLTTDAANAVGSTVVGLRLPKFTESGSSGETGIEINGSAMSGSPTGKWDHGIDIKSGCNAADIAFAIAPSNGTSNTFTIKKNAGSGSYTDFLTMTSSKDGDGIETQSMTLHQAVTCSLALTVTGNLAISGASTFTTGTGAVSLNGATTMAANKDFSAAAGTSAFSWGSATGDSTFSTGAHSWTGASGKAATLAATAANIALSTTTSGTISAISAGVLTLTAGASSTWSTSAGALTITSAAAATWSTAVGALTVDSAAALNLGTAVATSVSISRSGVTTTVNGSLTVTENLVVNGDTITVNTATLSVEDPLISLGINNGADSVDLGFYATYTSTGTKYAGLFRDATDGIFKFYSGSGTEPTTTVDTGAAGYVAAAVTMGALVATTGAFSSTLSSTGNLSVNTDKFVVTAATGATTMAGLLTPTAGATITGAALTISTGSSYSQTVGAFTYNVGGSPFAVTSAAFTVSAGAASSISTTVGALTLDAAAALNLGGTNATSVAMGHSGITTTITGGLTQLTGAISLTGNAASSVTTSSGALTLTSGASATWSTSTGALTLTSAAAATWSTVVGALTLNGAYGAKLQAKESASSTPSYGVYLAKTYAHAATVGTTCAVGDLVYFANTNQDGVLQADANVSLAASRVVGVAVSEIAQASYGEVAHDGVVAVNKISTEVWAAGDPIYLSATAGSATKTAPTTEGSTWVTLIGYAVAAAANPSAQGYVKLQFTAPVAN